ncbi:hypothetical protein HDV05_006447 [Chytridiales sp. JEL 0842]|nr:hypothetical protein HDV05_006447 [Chytridiales sp. JEL 0842]
MPGLTLSAPAAVAAASLTLPSAIDSIDSADLQADTTSVKSDGTTISAPSTKIDLALEPVCQEITLKSEPVRYLISSVVAEKDPHAVKSQQELQRSQEESHATTLVVDGAAVATQPEKAVAEYGRKTKKGTTIVEMPANLSTFTETWLYAEFPLWFAKRSRDSSRFSRYPMLFKDPIDSTKDIDLERLQKTLHIIQDKYDVLRLRLVQKGGFAGFRGKLRHNFAEILPPGSMPSPPMLKVGRDVYVDYKKSSEAAAKILKQEKNMLVSVVNAAGSNEAQIYFNHAVYDILSLRALELDIHNIYGTLSKSAASEAQLRSAPTVPLVTKQDIDQAAAIFKTVKDDDVALSIVFGAPERLLLYPQLSVKHHRRLGVVHFHPQKEGRTVIPCIFTAFMELLPGFAKATGSASSNPRQVSWYSQRLAHTPGKVGNNIIQMVEKMELPPPPPSPSSSLTMTDAEKHAARQQAIELYNNRNKAHWDLEWFGRGLYKHILGKKASNFRGSMHTVTRIYNSDDVVDAMIAKAKNNKKLTEFGRDEWVAVAPWLEQRLEREFDGPYFHGASLEVDLFTKEGVILVQFYVSAGGNERGKAAEKKRDQESREAVDGFGEMLGRYGFDFKLL